MPNPASDFEKQLAKFGLVVRAHLLGHKLLCGGGVLLLYLVPLRQSRDLAVREMIDQVVGTRQQIGLPLRTHVFEIDVQLPFRKRREWIGHAFSLELQFCVIKVPRCQPPVSNNVRLPNTLW